MENILIDIKRKILDARCKQSESVNIVRSIDMLGKEREFYGLLQKHTKRIGKLDNKLERLYDKKKDYKALMNEIKETY